MLKIERHRQILKIVHESGKAEVPDLSRRLKVSEMTIRRDLSELDERGLIERVHGGAVLQQVERVREELPVIERTKDSPVAKERIGQAVAGLINDGEKIFLGSGSTTMAVAQHLSRHRNLTVLTNAMTVANVLLPYPEITVVVIGGFLRRTEMSLIGHFAEATLKGIQVDKVIIGIRGIDPVKGLTSDHMEELLTDQAILGISKHVLVVADHTKLGHVAAIRTAPLTVVSKIVTNRGGPKDILSAIRLMGIEVLEV